MAFIQYGQTQTETATKKVPNALWYRDNASYLTGVTNAGSNVAFGIQNIRLNEASPAQKEYGIQVNGLLSTVVGNISFQIRNSPRTGVPFVQTISGKIENPGQETRYWEHIQLTPQVKAQILRHYESAIGGQAQVQHAPPAQYQNQGGLPNYQPQTLGTPATPTAEAPAVSEEVLDNAVAESLPI